MIGMGMSGVETNNLMVSFKLIAGLIDSLFPENSDAGTWTDPITVPSIKPTASLCVLQFKNVRWLISYNDVRA